MKSPLRVAVFQVESSHDLAANAKKIHHGVNQALAERADLLVLPECSLTGYLPCPDLDFSVLAQVQQEIAQHAAEACIWIAFGTVRAHGKRWYNTAFLYSPTGQLAAAYDKTHLMPNEVGMFTPGDNLPVFQEGVWTFGIQICFDMRFPENWRILRRKGAEMVIHLSSASRSAAWKVPVLEGAVRSRAAENGMFVVSANDAGRPQMMVSAICDPDGQDLARAAENEEVMIFADLDRTAVKTDFLDARRTDLWRKPDHRDLLLS